MTLSASDRITYVDKIPVRNLWLLMFFASDLFRQRGHAKIAFEESPEDLPKLVAEILTRCVENRLKKNLTFGYQEQDLILKRLRGRIDLLRTERRQLLDRGMVACKFESLTVDTTRNRLVRGALVRLARILGRDNLARRCRTLAATLQRLGVSGIVFERDFASLERLGRNDTIDRQMVSAAQLAFRMALPTEYAGTQMLFSPSRDVRWVRRLFERGVAGFYSTVLPAEGWNIYAGKTIRWPADCQTSGIKKILPTMITDVILDHPQTGRRIVVDTKFNAVVVPGQYREFTLRSEYIYQIYAYVRSQAGNNDARAANASGLLLHPSVGETIRENVMIQGHEFRFATVDLAADAKEISAQLRQVIEPWSPRALSENHT